MRTASFKVKKVSNSFSLHERIVFEKKNKSLFAVKKFGSRSKSTRGRYKESNFLLSYEKRNTTKQRFTSFCVSRVELNAGILLRGSTGKCKFVNYYYPFIFRDTAALFNYTYTIHGPQCSIAQNFQREVLVLLNM